MTALRSAAQQALEALEGKRYTACGWRADCDKAITALKAALVEDAMQKFTDVNQELEAALAEPENWELRRLREELERCKQVCAATSEAWREEAALGCDHCNSPLYAAVKCRVCGRVTEPVQEPPEFPPHDDKVHAGAVYWYVGTDGKYYSSNEVKLFMEVKNKSLHYEPPKWVLDNFDLIPLYTAPPQPEERNFCSRCGKRTQDIHTCTPP